MVRDLVITIFGIAGMVVFGIVVPMLYTRALRRGMRLVVPARGTPQEEWAAALPPLHFWLVLGISVSIFLALLGPVWRRDYDVDRAVLLSYLAIPLLVLGALRLGGRLTLRSFLGTTLLIAVVKFMITASIVVSVWAIWGPSKRPTMIPLPVVEEPARVKEAPPEKLRIARGKVIDRSGQAIAGAIVYVRSGLERFQYPPPAGLLVLENDGTGFRPAFGVAQASQRWEVRSTDGRLHTLVGIDGEGRQRFNQAAPSGAEGLRAVPDVTGLFTLECAVHREEGTERPARLLVVRHPYYTTSDAEGRYELEVPDLELVLAAHHPERGPLELVSP